MKKNMENEFNQDEVIENEIDHENILRNEELELGDNIIENEVNDIIEEKKEKELSDLKRQILKISEKFLKDWGTSPGMGFLAGLVRPLVTVARIEQVLKELERDGYILRIMGPRYHKGFRLLNKNDKDIVESIKME